MAFGGIKRGRPAGGSPVRTSPILTSALLTLATALTLPTPATAAIGISVTKQLVSGAPVIGGPLTYQIVVLNSGNTTITSLTISDTIPPPVCCATTYEPAGLATPSVASVATGTRYVWSLGGLNLVPGLTFTFTIDGILGPPPCNTVTCSNTALVSAVGSGNVSAQSIPVTFVLAAPTFDYIARIIQTPVVLGIGGPVTYRIDVTNTGGATITGVTVMDTVAPIVMGTATDKPASMGPAVVTSVAGGTLIVWSNMAATLLPGMTFTFTIAGQCGAICTNTTVSNTAFVSITSACGVTTTTLSNPVGSVVQPAAAGLIVSNIQAPASPGTGAPVRYLIVVQNAGAQTLTTLTVTDTISPLVTSATAWGPPSMGTPFVLGGASGTRFSWSSGAIAMTPGTVFTFTISGTVGTSCVATTVSNTAFITGAGSCSTTVLSTNPTAFFLSAPSVGLVATKMLAAVPSAAGDPVLWRIVVTNISSTTVTNLAVSDTLPPVYVSTTTAEPAGFPAPVISNLAGATNFYWSASTIQFFPGTSWTFTLSGTVGTVASTTSVSNTAFVSGGTSCAQTGTYTNAVGFTVSPSPAIPFGVSLTKTAVSLGVGGPGSVAPGDWVWYRLTYSITGSATTASLTVFDTLPASVHYVTLSALPDPDPGFDPDYGPPTRLRWTIPGPFPAGTRTGVIEYYATVDWGNGEAFEPNSGDLAAPQGGSLANAARADWAGQSSPPSGAAVAVDWYNFTKSATDIGNGFVQYDLAVQSRSDVKTWWNVSVWDTVPANLDVWGAGSGFEDPCNGWSMTPSGCPAGAPAVSLVGGTTILRWTIDLPPLATLALRWRARLAPAVNSCTLIANEASILARGRTGIVDGTGSALNPAVDSALLALCSTQPLALAVTVSATGGAGVGAPLAYRIVVTNAGGATISGLTLSDTLAPQLVGVTAAAPAAFGAPAVSQVAGGTLYLWSAAGLTFRPGQAYTFTLTGLVGASCSVVTVSEAARATATDGSAVVSVLGAAAPLAVAQAAAGLTVSQLITPDLAAPGDPVTYRIVVENSGASTLTAFTVSDTLSPLLVLQAVDQVAPFAAPVFTPVAGGTRYVWSAAGLFFTPGQTFTFTLTGVAGDAPAGTTVNATPFVDAYDPCWNGWAFTNQYFWTVSAAGAGTTPPSAPGPLTGYGQIYPGNGYFYLSWQDATAGTNPLSGYAIYRATCPTCALQPYGVLSYYGSGYNTFLDPAPIPSAWLTYEVRAVDTTGLEGPGSVLVIHAPDLVVFDINKTLAPAAPVPGQTVTYRIVATALTAGHTAIQVADSLPVGILNPVTDQPAAFAAQVAGNGVIWSATADVAAGDIFTFTISGQVADAVSPFVACNNAWLLAQASAGLLQVWSWTQSADVCFSVTPSGSLVFSVTATKDVVPASANPGDPVTWRILVANTGSVTVNEMWVNDIVPYDMIVGSTDQPTTVDPAFTWDVGSGTGVWWYQSGISLAPGETWTFTVAGTVADAPSATTVCNSAEVFASNTDLAASLDLFTDPACFATTVASPPPDCGWPLVWSRTLGSPDASSFDYALTTAVDGCGNLNVSGAVHVGGQDRWTVRQYGADGSVHWTDTYVNPFGNSSFALAVATDAAGNVIAGGRTWVPGEGWNWLLRKSGPDGTLIWSRSYNGPANDWDEITGVATDSAGDIIAAGHHMPAAGDRDLLVRKYAPDGSLLWQRTAGHPLVVSDGDGALATAVDPSDNVIVTGYEQEGDGTAHWLVLKYDPAGTLLWTRTSSSPLAGVDARAQAVTVDPAGIITVGGHELPTVWPNYNWRIVSFDPNGTVRWTARHAGSGNSNDFVKGMTALADGSVLVAGSETTAGGRDWLVRHYDVSGTLLCQYTYAGAAGQDDEALDVATTADGGIYVAGYETDASMGGNWLVRRFGTAGVPCGPTPPTAPQGLTAQGWAITGLGGPLVSLSWNTPASTGTSPISTYEVYRASCASCPDTPLGTNVLISFMDSAPLPGELNRYRVRAVNQEGLTGPFAVVDLFFPAAAQLALSKVLLTPAPVPGGPVGYRIDVANVGRSTVTTLAVIDTPPDFVVGIGGELPAGFTPWTPAGVTPTSTRYETSAAGLTMTPGQVYSFTLTGTLDPAVSATLLCNQALVQAGAMAGNAGYWNDGLTNPVCFSQTPTAPVCTPSLVLSESVKPQAAEAGGVIEYRISFTNDSTCSALGVTITTAAGSLTDRTVQASSPADIWWSGEASPVVDQAWATNVVGPWTPGDGAGQTDPVFLRWTLNRVGAGQTGFVIYRAQLTGAPCAVLPAGVTATLWGGVAGSDFSGTLFAGTVSYGNCGTPAGPFSLTATGLTGAVTLIWDYATPGLQPISAYEIWRASCSGCPSTLLTSVNGTASVFADGSAVPGVTYDYHVRAVDQGGNLGNFGPTASAAALPPPVSALTVVKTASPATTFVGQPVTYRIVVTNSGATTLVGLQVIDTLSPPLTAAATQYPPIFIQGLGANIVTGETLNVGWSSTSVGMAPGESLTFTVTGVPASGPGTVCNTVWAGSVWGGPSASALSNAACVTLLPPPPGPGLTVLKQQVAPSSSEAVSGDPVVYRIVATNSGTTTITDLLVVDTLPALVVNFATSQPVPLGPPTLVRPAYYSGTILAWSASGLSMLPGDSFTFTITGTAGNTIAYCAGPCVLINGASNVAWILAGDGIGTTATLTGQTDFGLVTPPAAPATLTALVAGGNVNLSWAAATAGSNAISAYEIWRATCAACTASLLATTDVSVTVFADANAVPGLVYRYTVRAVDALGVAGPFSPPADHGTVALLNCQISFQPDPPVVGSSFQVIQTVSNTGTARVDFVDNHATMWESGSVYVDAWAPPVYLDQVLFPGMSYAFAWTYTAVGAGPISFTATAGGFSHVGGAPVTTACSAATSIIVPPTLAVSVVKTLVQSGGIGDTWAYRITVANTGSATIQTMTITDTLSPVLVGATVYGMPPPVVTSVAGGGTRYLWTGAGLNLAPGLSFTFTVAGKVGAVCTPTLVSNTVLVAATDGTTTVIAAATAATFNVQLPLDAPWYSLSVTPSATLTGAPVVWRLVMTNFGGSTLSALTLIETLPPIVTNLSFDQPAGFGAPTVTGGASATRIVWSGGPSFPPGATFTYTVTGVAGSAPAETAMSGSVWLSASNGCYQIGGSASVATLTITGSAAPAPVLAIGVSKVLTASGGIGAPAGYRIVVANTGTATVTALSVTDTLSPILTGLATSQPAGFGAPAVTGGAAATRYVWSAGALSFAPGQSLTFTVTGNVGVLCVTTVVSNTAFVVAGDGTTTVYGQAVSGSFTVLPAAAALVATKQVSLSVTSPGGVVSYRIVVANTGSATLTGVTVVDTVAAAFMLAAGQQPAGFGAPIVTGGPAVTRFEWSSGVPLTPGASFTFTLTGIAGSAPIGTVVANTAYVSAGTDCLPLNAFTNPVAFTITGSGAGSATSAVLSVFAMKTVSSVALMSGQAGQFTITVFNSGTDTITSLTVVDTVAPVFVTGSPVEPKGFTPPVITSVAATGTRFVWSQTGLSLAPGSLTTYTIPFAAGVVSSSVVWPNVADVFATGGTGNAMAQASTSCTVSPCLVCITIPVLTCGITISNPTPHMGDVVTCTARIRNTGSGKCTGGLVTITLTDPTICALIQAPLTSGWTLVPGDEIVLVWTYKYIGNGNIIFTVTAKAVDPATGLDVVAPPAQATSTSPAPQPPQQPIVITGGPRGWVNPDLGHPVVIRWWSPFDGQADVFVYSHGRRVVKKFHVPTRKNQWHKVVWMPKDPNFKKPAPGPYHVLIHNKPDKPDGHDKPQKLHGNLAVRYK